MRRRPRAARPGRPPAAPTRSRSVPRSAGAGRRTRDRAYGGFACAGSLGGAPRGVVHPGARSGCKNLRVASATALEKVPSHGSLTRPSVVSVGTIVWLSSELMFFAALFAMYFTIRAVNEPIWPAKGVVLDLKTAAEFTIILVLSSVTCQLGVFAAERGDVGGLRFWFAITFFMGAVFIGGQSFEYFVHNEFSLASHGYGSV